MNNQSAIGNNGAYGEKLYYLLRKVSTFLKTYNGFVKKYNCFCAFVSGNT